ncbi:MAG: tyrosine-type recombinase/integrase, partial [bacterium]
MKRRSLGWTFRRGRSWYIGYFADEIKDGRKIRRKVREAVGSKKSDATARLAQRLRELDDGKWTNPTKPLTFDDVLALVKSDWRNQGRKSALTLPDGKTEQSGIRRLRKAFGCIEAASITEVQLANYSNARQDDEGAAVSTVRNELNVLKHGLYLAKKARLLTTVPTFPTLTPKTVRTGFFERHELDAILAELPELVRPLALFMYWTGWRRGEVLSREWRHVDWTEGTIQLDPGETKNGKGRDFPFTLLPELQELIEQQRAYTDAVERRTGQIVPFVFHREGRQIKSFRSAWRLACKRVALAALAAAEGKTAREVWKAMSREERREFKGSGRIPHDFRRTAVRNLVRAGVSQKVAMELTGHLTPSVFERYNITDDRDRRDA